MKKVLIDEQHLQNLIKINQELAEKNQELINTTNNLLKIVEGKYTSKHIWIDCQEVCKLLYISKSTLKHYRQERIILFTDYGGKLLYDKRYIEKHLEKHIHKTK